MRNTILIALVSLVIFSCKKDTYSSIPKLTYKSVNTKTLYPKQVIKFTLNVTDAEGDISDTMYVQKININKVKDSCNISSFSDKYPVPKFPSTKNLNQDILVSFASGINIPIGAAPDKYYVNIAFGCSVNDTCYFKFIIKDKANHKSDTVRSENIVIVKQ